MQRNNGTNFIINKRENSIAKVIENWLKGLVLQLWVSHNTGLIKVRYIKCIKGTGMQINLKSKFFNRRKDWRKG